MSGSTRVCHTSEWYRVSSESPCMNFVLNPEDPGFEQRWHREWRQKGEAWLEQVKPILEQRFAMLAANPDPEWPILKYDEAIPRWNPYQKPSPPPPWRLEFLGMNGPGMTMVAIAFSAMPSDEAKERLKQELIKDVAMLDPNPGGF